MMDHFVNTRDGKVVHIPRRVMQNGEGAEFMLMLFRQTEMTGKKFSANAKWIMLCMRARKALMEN